MADRWCGRLLGTTTVYFRAFCILLYSLFPLVRPLSYTQVTADLAGFWRSSYSLVRRDMKGEYPRHYWPEDPSQAEATRLTKKGMEREAAKAAAAQEPPQKRQQQGSGKKR